MVNIFDTEARHEPTPMDVRPITSDDEQLWHGTVNLETGEVVIECHE